MCIYARFCTYMALKNDMILKEREHLWVFWKDKLNLRGIGILNLVLGRESCCNPPGTSLLILHLCTSTACYWSGKPVQRGSFDPSKIVCDGRLDVINYRFSPISHLTKSVSHSPFPPLCFLPQTATALKWLEQTAVSTLGHVQGRKCDGME